MQQDLVAAAMRFFGDVGGKRQMRQHRNRQRKRQRQQRIGRGAVVAQVVDDDRELPGFLLAGGRGR